MTKKNLLIFLLVACASALTFAYISQYVFNYQPCILCLYQRKPLFAIIATVLISLTFFKSDKSKKFAILICAALLLVNFVIASYHVGVEKKIFRGPTTCSSTENLNEISNLEDLKNAFTKTKAIRCDEPTFVVMGVSMAAMSALYCLALLIVISWNFRRKILSMLGIQSH